MCVCVCVCVSVFSYLSIAELAEAVEYADNTSA